MEKEIFKNSLRQYIITSFDNLLASIKSITKEWNKETVPLILLKETIEIAKFKNPDKKDKILCKIEKDHHTMMNKLYTTCESIADVMNSKEVPISLLEECIKVIKDNFNIGYNKNK